jgi:hypothetical protein
MLMLLDDLTKFVGSVLAFSAAVELLLVLASEFSKL